MTKMTPDETNRHVAEWMGYVNPRYDWPDGNANWKEWISDNMGRVPSFVGSLDAIALAEARLTDEEHWRFQEILRDITDNSLDWNGKLPHRWQIGRAYISATAAQRSEALLRTVQPQLFTT